MTEAEVLQALSDVVDPEIGRSLVKNNQIQNVRIEPSAISLQMALTTWSAPLWKQIKADAVELLCNRFSVDRVDIDIVPHERPAERLGQIGLTAKSVIAVGSGKGGVGKSTIAASLAYGLKKSGAAVGLMDADVYGPSIPHLLGVDNGRPEVDAEKRIQPVLADGMPTMSIGYLVPAEEAVVWRGPMLHHAMTQFLRDTEWGELDYLIIDMPPGTGDVSLSLSQLLPLTGSVVVCTPQDVALLDAVKAIAMFRKVNIPVLGMVENMSYFLCPDNGKRYEIFGSGGAQKRAAELDVPFLGEVPINIQVRVNGDEGKVGDSLADPQSGPFLETLGLNLVKSLAKSRKEEPPLPSLSVL